MMFRNAEAPDKATGQPTFIREAPRILEAVNNHIYFYSDIEESSVLQLIRQVRELDCANVAAQVLKGLDKPDPIYLHIHSYGGYVFAGLAAMDNLLGVRSELRTVVEGVAASAATFLSVTGKHRSIGKHGFMLIHQLSSFMWGKYRDFEDHKRNLDLIMAKIKLVYTTHTNVPAERLDGILDRDLYFDAEECLRLGMVDEIL